MATEQLSSGSSDGTVPAEGSTPTPAPSPPKEPSTGELLRGLADDLTTLARQEVLLARQEIKEGMAATCTGSGSCSPRPPGPSVGRHGWARCWWVAG